MDATTELLEALDVIYPLPDDGLRDARAMLTAEALKRWIQRTCEELAADVRRRLAVRAMLLAEERAPDAHLGAVEP